MGEVAEIRIHGIVYVHGVCPPTQVVNHLQKPKDLINPHRGKFHSLLYIAL
jgi:hypothetical protein